MGWKKSGSRWWYDQGNGKYPRSKWMLLGGVWYYFDGSGYMVTGWLKYGGKWYFLSASGAMMTGWINVRSSRYHLASSGAMDVGWFTDTDGKVYYLEPSGAMFANGLKQIGGKWYRFDKNGVMTACLTTSEGRKVANLKLERKETVFTGKWSYPSAVKNGDEQYSSVTSIWEVACSPQETLKRTAPQSIDESTTSLDLDAFAATSPDEEYDRTSFYPLTNRKVTAVKLSIVGKGTYVKTATAEVTHSLVLPTQPEVSWSYNPTTGLISAHIDSPEKAETGERYDTMYMVKVKGGSGTEQVITSWTSTSESSLTVDYDTSSYMSGLAAGQVVEFTLSAYNRGLRGDNPDSGNPVTVSRTLAYPNAATIKSVIPTSKETTGRITVTIEVGANTDSVKLQRRHGETGNWQDVQGATDNGNATTLYDSVGLAEPVDGEYLYYRLYSTKDNLTTTGDPFRADLLYTPRTTTSSTSVGIVSLEMDTDGDGAKMVVGWTETKVGYATEVSWSTDPNAWESNKRPDLYEIVWEDDESQSTDWEHTAVFYVRDLTPGVTYYFKARRAYEDGNYSAYASRTNVATYSETSTVSLSAPSTVVRGDPIPLVWSYSGTATQTEYHVHPVGSPRTALASGRDSMTNANILPERYGDAESISMYVSVGVGGELTDSNSVSVLILDAPLCSIECDPTCTAKPVTFEAYTDAPSSRIGYKVVAEGVVQYLPDREVRQLYGDVVATGMVTPEWDEVSWSQTARYARLQQELSEAEDQDEESQISAELESLTGTIYSAEIAVGDAHLIDGATYTIEAFADDSSSGLSSKPTAASFVVEWSHQAPVPSDQITVTPDLSSRLAVVSLAAPSGAVASDVYDLYRGTADGYDLIREGLPTNAVVTDRYAAFGSQRSYRVCTRTADGDIEWATYNYDMPLKAMRFDWADGSGETVYNVKLSDSYSKSFEARPHMDGSIGGYWGPSVSKTGSYSSTCIVGVDDGPMEELARHEGEAFCRTPDGNAYRCNVNVTRTHDNSSLLVNYSLDITRVDLSDTFRPSDEDVEGLVV